MLHRKDFVTIAEILHFRQSLMTPSTFESLVQDFAEWLKTTNPKFNESKFIDKCFHK